MQHAQLLRAQCSCCHHAVINLLTLLWKLKMMTEPAGFPRRHAYTRKKLDSSKAVDYALANSSRPDSSVRSEVRRYFNNPSKATASKIGMLKIIEYREKAKAQLGEKFDIKGFHDTVLGSGPVPMTALETLVDRWIAWVESLGRLLLALEHGFNTKHN